MSTQTSASAPTDGDTSHSPSALRSRLPWIVAIAAVALAVFATYRWVSLASEIGPVRAAEEIRAEVEATAGTFLLELTTWDAANGLAETRDRLRELGTGEFLDEVDQLFGAELAAELRDVQATSSGEVQDLFVQRIDGDRAVVFGVVLQTQDTTRTDPDTIVRSARVVLERVEGVWKVSRVEMVDAGTTDVGDVTRDGEGQP